MSEKRFKVRHGLDLADDLISNDSNRLVLSSSAGASSGPANVVINVKTSGNFEVFGGSTSTAASLVSTGNNSVLKIVANNVARGDFGSVQGNLGVFGPGSTTSAAIFDTTKSVVSIGNITDTTEKLNTSGSIQLIGTGSIYAKNSHLILSSSVGSIVAVSGSLLVTEPTSIITRGLIYNDFSDLILSSSSRSLVTVSSSLRVFASASGQNAISIVQAGPAFAGGFIVDQFGHGVHGIPGGVALQAQNSQHRLRYSTVSAFDVLYNNSVIFAVNISGTVVNPSSHLILSSSAGSVVALSSTLDLATFDKNYHIKATNSTLILSSSNGEEPGNGVAISGSLRLKGTSTTGAMIKEVSNAFQFRNSTDTSYANVVMGSCDLAALARVNASQTHLILSSSAGSVVFVSGTLSCSQGASVNGLLSLVDGPNSNIRGAGTLFIAGNSISMNGPTGGTITVDINDNLIVRNRLHSSTGHLILSSSVGSQITVSGTLNVKFGSFQQSNAAAANLFSDTQFGGNFVRIDGVINSYGSGVSLFRAINQHLILSSSAGSLITNSGSFRSTGYVSASLPNPETVQSGTITFVNDLGFLAIAWDGTWQRILTGSF